LAGLLGSQLVARKGGGYGTVRWKARSYVEGGEFCLITRYDRLREKVCFGGEERRDPLEKGEFSLVSRFVSGEEDRLVPFTP